MATYEDIYGKRVKEFDSDPTLTSSYEGQVWYDKSSGTLRSVVAFGAWASSSSLAGAVRSAVGSSGTQTASLSVGGEPGPGYFNLVEEYNGSGWATATNYPLSIQGPLVAGTQTAAVVCGVSSRPNQWKTNRHCSHGLFKSVRHRSTQASPLQTSNTAVFKD